MKRHLLIVAFLIISLTGSVQAGTWEPNPEKVYSFDANSCTTYGQSQSDTKWIKSLLRKLRKHGAVKSHSVFLRTNLKLYLNENPLPSILYVSANNNNLFLSYKGEGQKFIIDFENQRVVIPYGGGTSFHQQHKKQFVVAVSPASNELGGVPVSSGGKKPVFKEKSVTWY